MNVRYLTKDAIDKLIDRPGRHGDGDGLYFRAIGERRAYWVYRYRAAGKEREISIGPYLEVSLAEARIKHADLRKRVVVDKRDPVAEKRAAKASAASDNASAATKPTFGECADHHIAAHAASCRNPRNEQQWRMTLTAYCATIRSTPVDKVDTEAVLSVLKPIWTKTPETASRLRGRIEAVLASAQVDGHIHQDRTNPARWRGWLDRKLPNPKKIGKPRGHYAALPYADLPDFMTRLGREPGTVAKALAFIILTAARSGEALGMTWDEVDLATATWTIPASRMKVGKAHVVPLSDQPLAILRGQYETRGKNPHVFPSHLPRQALWSASLALALRRLGTNATTHGMRASFRMWAADQGIAFEVAEQCLAHTVGSAVVQAYQRSSMLASTAGAGPVGVVRHAEAGRQGGAAAAERALRPHGFPHMIRIAITQAAFEAIAATLPLGSVGYENATNERGEMLIWLDANVVSRLRAMRGPGVSYSDVILRLVASADGSGRDPVTEGRVRG